MKVDELSSAVALEAIGAPVLLVAAGSVRHANAAALQMTGYSLSDLIDMPLTQLLSDGVALDQPVEAFPCSVYTAGSCVPVTLSARPVMVGSQPGYLLTLLPVAPDKSDLEAKYRLLAENISDIIIMSDQDGTIQFVSPSVERVLGYRPDQFVSITEWVQIIHPQDVDALMSNIQLALLDQQQYISSEFRLRHRDGHFVWCESGGRVARQPDGRATAISVVREIGKRRIATEALESSEARLRVITENMRDLLAQTDAMLCFAYINPAFAQVLGYEPKDLLGRSVFELVHPDDLTAVQQRAVRAIERRESATIDFRYRHAEGYYIWLETVGNLILDAAGNFQGAVFVSRDITDRRRMQRAILEGEKLSAALQKEQDLSALKSKMMMRISHEFRTPLSVILSSTELLQLYGERMNKEQRSEHYNQIHHQIHHLTSNLEDIALVVRGMLEPLQFQPLRFDVRELVLSIVRDQQLSSARQITVALQIDSMLPPVIADPKLLRLIIANLLSNAIKYSPPDSEVLLGVDAAPKTLTIVVHDTGIGIPYEEQKGIFDPFFRGSNIGERAGLGIGLRIVKDAVETHRGTLYVQSVPGKGTTFTVRLPQGDGIPTAVANEAAATSESGDGS